MGFRGLIVSCVACMALSLESLDLDCEDHTCALSLRQLRGQQFEASVAEHGSLAEPSPGEGTEDPYSKAPETATTDTTEGEAAKDPPAETATAETQGEGTEDPYSKAPEAPAEAPAETPAAETAPAKTPAAEAPAETPAEAPAETPAAETAPAKTPAAETAPADSTEGEGTEDPYSKAPEDTATADSTADAEETEESTMTQEKWEEKQGGLCCYSGEDYNDACNSCYPTAIASFKSPCAANGDKCVTCGGSWCQPKCVIGAADPKNKCKTAFHDGVADSKSLCSSNATSCASCNGEWCRLGVTKVAGGAGVVNSGSSQAASATSSAATGGFCCYRGNVFAKDMCTACEDVSQDMACANSKGCGTCGGTWCAGPRCVKAYSNQKDPCGSAYKGNVAPLSDYCAGSENRCTDCGGAWCSSNGITYDDGEKFDPDGPEEATSESSDDEDDEPSEPSGFEPLTDLLPHGLAKKA